MSEALRAGYRLTEVGVLPEDWIVSNLGEVCAFENGDRGSNYPSPGSFVHSGIPFINAGHVAEGKISSSGMNYITRESFSRLGGGKIRAGDILFCLRGSLGKFGVVSNEFGEGAIASSLVIVRAKLSTVIREYLDYYFSSDLCANMIDTWSGGAAQPNLGAKDLARFLIPLPPTKEEQHAIAAAFSDIDTLLAKLDELIAKKRNIKQATMQQLLTGQTRLPGFSGEWEVKRLGDITECLDNVRVPLNESQRNQMRGEYPYCGANGVLDYVNDYVLDDDVILMAEDGGYFDEYAYRPIAYRMIGKCWINNHAHILKAKAGYHQSLLFYLLVHKNIQSFLASGTRAKLNKSEMNKIEVRLSLDIEEQTAIASLLDDMDAELATLETRREKTLALKQGMMQELLTGRIRLL